MANKTKCIKQETKKYLSRPSPPFPAGDCKRKTKKGNNGKMFKSKEYANGVYRWVPVVSSSKNKTKKSKK
jgi:hypothetical protein